MKPEECKNGCPPNQVCDHCQVGEWKDISDPEELFRLRREGWEIELKPHIADWCRWDGVCWSKNWKFRARPRQPKMKKMKTLCWIHKHTGAVFYGFMINKANDGWIRQPHLDLEGEVPE